MLATLAVGCIAGRRATPVDPVVALGREAQVICLERVTGSLGWSTTKP
jgi:hypothetical protein